LKNITGRIRSKDLQDPEQGPAGSGTRTGRIRSKDLQDPEQGPARSGECNKI